jgi:hypothetical protein
VQPVSSRTHAVIDSFIIAGVAAVVGFAGLGLINFAVFGLILAVALTVRYFSVSATDEVCDGRQFRIGPFLYVGSFASSHAVSNYTGRTYDYVVEKISAPDPPFVLALTGMAFLFFLLVGYYLDSGMPQTRPPPSLHLPARQGGANGTNNKRAIKKKG